MSTTTIRLDDELKARVAAAAERAGKTAHGFIVDAIAGETERSEIEAQFHQVADERWARFLRTGKAIPWGEGRAYLEALARGERPTRPAARKPR
jgi:predicted transcriptional regulator